MIGVDFVLIRGFYFRKEDFFFFFLSSLGREMIRGGTVGTMAFEPKYPHSEGPDGLKPTIGPSIPTRTWIWTTA